MLKRFLPLAALVLFFANCTQEYLPQEDLTNKDKMNQIDISDPLIWNSLATQSMEIDTTGSGMKAGTGMMKKKVHPEKGYYFSLFEDLYPSQGDYDFNDVVLQTRIELEGKKGEVWGTVKTTVANDGGKLPTKIGLMFYSVKGNKEYTVIDNSDIEINGVQLTGVDPFTMELPAEGKSFEVDYYVSDGTKNVNQIWIAWYIVVESQGKKREIHTSGFPASKNRKFEIPQMDYLTLNNLPWGMEIEAEEFAIPVERALFTNAYPNFKEWATSDGKKQKDWYEKPDRAHTK